MYLAPRKRLYRRINDIGTIAAYLKYGRHGKSWPTMTMILDNDIRMLLLNHTGKLSQHGRLTYTGHILQAYLWCTGLNQLLRNGGIIFCRMYWRIGNTQRSLRCHPCFQCILYGRYNITYIIQSAENTGNISTLSVLYLVHQSTHIGRNWEHTYTIQTTIQHVSLDTSLLEGFGKGTYRFVGVLTIHQIHLFKGTSISFNTTETSHLHYYWSNTLQLIHTRLELTRRLKHVTINETEFYPSLLHN